jgi:CubicO group peptidase (beta-lactamase class C family)
MNRNIVLSVVLGLIAGCAPSPSSEEAVFSPEQAERLGREVNVENWDDGGEISRFAFLSIPKIFPTAVIPRGGGEVLALETALEEDIARHEVALADGGVMAFDDYVDSGALDGIVILRGGKVVYERYPRMRSTDRHILFSVSKVLVSTVVAILEDRGLVDVSKPVEVYLPALRETAWEGIPVLDVLDMASGIDALEGIEDSYTNPERTHYQYEASLGWLPKVEGLPSSVMEEDTLGFIASLEKRSEPGKMWEYVSVNTMVLAWLAEEVTGKKFHEVLSERIWARMGAEADAQVSVNSRGHGAVHGGIVATLRDVARFGLLFTRGRGRGVVSASYLTKILEGGRPELLEAAGRASADVRHATYQWDRVYEDGSFFKGGFGGQGLYVSPEKDVVLAYFGTHGYDAPAPSVLDACRRVFEEVFRGDSPKT